MDFDDMSNRASEIKHQYAELNRIVGHHQWSVAEYVQGFVGDVGGLVKLTMAKNEFRDADDVDQKIAHELVDCLWSVLVIADELGIDLEAAFTKEMTKLEHRIAAAGENVLESQRGT